LQVPCHLLALGERSLVLWFRAGKLC